MDRIKSKKSKKLNKIFISVLFAILSIAGGLYGIGNYMQARAAGAPSVQKNVIDNKDGTYTISLDVTGDADKNYNKANVIIVLDSSGSMDENTGTSGYYPSNTNGYTMYGYIDGEYIQLTRNYSYSSGYYYTYRSNGSTHTYTGTRYLHTNNEERMEAAKGAVMDLARGLLSNNTTSGSGSDLIEIALIDFDTNASIAQQPTTNLETFANSLASITAGGGTNWEAALQKAADVNFNDPANEKNTTYVIFVSDGNPTFHSTNDGYNDWNRDAGVYGTGQEGATNVTNCYNSAKDDARTLVNPKKYEFYTIGVYGNVTRMEDLTKYALNTTESVENKNYFSAANTAKLQEALNTILQKIELAGFGEVSVNDGTTKNVSVSSGTEQGGLIDVDTDSYKYYLSFPITVNGNTITSGAERIKSVVKNNDGTYKLTNDKNQVFDNIVRVPELDENGNEIATIFKMAWTSGINNPFYDKAAPAATLNSSNAVVWDLDDLGVLFDNVTYRVTFDVWPSQAALDLIADLKNGKITYGASKDDQNRPIDPKVWDYLDRNYGIKTNTNDAYVEYTDTRVANDTTHKVNFQTQDPIASAAAKILTVTKVWENELDSRSSTDISLKVNRDTETRYAVELPLKDENGNRVLDEDDNPIWSNSIYASVGIMTVKDGAVSIKEPGHDYSFAEEQNIAYYWELDAPTVHPMWINGQVDSDGNPVATMLIKQDNKPDGMGDANIATIGGKTYYKIGNSYYVEDNQLASLTATNTRRSYLQIVKRVDGKDAPADALFTYNIKVTDSNNGTVWFSIYDPATKEYIMNKPGSSEEPARNYISGTGVGPEVKLLIEKPEYADDFRKIEHKNGSDVITYEYCEHANSSNDCSANSDDWKAYTVKYVSGNSNSTYRYYTGFYTAPNNTDLTILLQKDWSLRFINLPKDSSYEVTESQMPDNFSFVSVSGDGEVDATNNKKVTGNISETNTGYNVTYTNKYELTSVKVTKDWQDNENQDGMRAPVSFSLYANGNKVDNKTIIVDGVADTVTDENKDNHETAAWEATFANLARFDDAGEEIVYTVDEDSVPSGYDKLNITGSMATGFIISNKHIPETYNEGFNITKSWIDFNNKNEMRPESITITLKGTITKTDGTKKTVYEKTLPISATTEGVTVSKNDNNNDVWTYTFKKDDGSNLDKYAEGIRIDYVLTENKVIGYTTDISDYDITNTLDSISIPVTKEWIDESDRDGVRPDSVKISLKANGKVIETKTIEKQLDENDKELDSWTATFENLNRLDSEGKAITYEVVELDENIPDGYETSVGCDEDGNTIIYNTYEAAKDDITVTKVWEDDSDRDGERPEEVTLWLLADGNKVGEITLDATKGDKQTHTFPDMPRNRDGGTAIVYTASEPSVPTGYTKDNDDTDLVVTNSRPIETDNITVTKVWKDFNDKNEIRPESISITLTGKDGSKPAYENSLSIGANTEGVTVSKDDNGNDVWTYIFKDVPVNANGGNTISYSVSETPVKGYNEPVVEGFKITNTLDSISIPVTKEWVDESDRDGQRPDSVKISLKANGTVIDTKTIEKQLDENNKELDSWTITFENLNRLDNEGNEITYEVVELDENIPEGYETSKGCDDDGNTIIYNTYEAAKDDITVTKVWDDDSDRDGQRPDEVTLLLLADGTEVDRITLDATNGDKQTYTFPDMPRNRDHGVAIVYTADELAVEGYTKDDNDKDLSVTNSRKIETDDITVTKVWDDDSDRDGQRPEEVTLLLLADGTEVDRITLDATKGDKQTYTFPDMPKYRDHGVAIVYTADELAVEGYTKDDDDKDLSVTNSRQIETDDITVTKVWEDDSDRDGARPDEVTLLLLADGAEVDRITLDATKGDKQTYTFPDMPKYRDHGVAIVYTADELAVEGYTKDDDDKDLSVTNSRQIETDDITVTKVWEDDSDRDGARPDEVTLLLLADGTEVDRITLDATDGDRQTHTFPNMPKYKNHGVAIVYTADELAVEGYTKDDNDKDLSVTNSRAIETRNITVKKVWDDASNSDGQRPETGATIHLLDGNTPIEGKSVTLKPQESGVIVSKDGNSLSYTFINLPVNKDHGTPINYAISEDAVSGYAAPIYSSENNGNTLVVTNKYTPDTTSITVTKVWDDDSDRDGKRPATVTLLVLDGTTEVDRHTINAQNGDRMSWTFDGLPRYKNGGTPIVYKVDEVTVEGYTKDINNDDYIITNSKDYETIDIPFEKVWNDNDDQDGLRPIENGITIKLLDGAEVVATKTVKGDGNTWSGSFDGMPKYKNHGETITYTIDEEPVSGYSKNITGNKITNTHIPETTSVSGVKAWADASDAEGFRPTDGVTIRLYADGTEIDSKVVKGEGDEWAYSFTGLPKYKEHGTKIVYTVSEDQVKNYDAPSYKEDKDGNKYIIVNTHSPKDLSITVKKVWEDTSEDGIKNIYGHPDNVEVLLTGKVGNTTYVSETATLSKDEVDEDGNWTHTFTELPEYREGMQVTYMVDEITTIKDYHKDVTSEIKDGVATFTVTNTYTPEEYTVINGEKTWKDDDNRDGLRPDTITIKVMDQYENEVASKDVTEEDNWSYEFNLPKYGYDEEKEEFVELNYTVSEVDVEGYESVVTGYNVTNTHEIATVSFHITKIWTDNTNNDGIRPNEITVRIIDKDTKEEMGKATITAEDNWYYEFKDLPKYKDGEPINYEIIEDEVPGYTYTVKPMEEDNDVDYVLENTHTDSLIDLLIKKVWDDNDDISQIRPNEITVDLYADDKLLQTIVIKDSDGWETTITGLKEFNGGVKIVYEVKEREIPEYETYYDVDGNTFTITNHHELGKGGDTPEELPPQTGIVYDNRGVFVVLFNMLNFAFVTKRTKED